MQRCTDMVSDGASHLKACELWSCYVDFLLSHGAPLVQLRDVQVGINLCIFDESSEWNSFWMYIQYLDMCLNLIIYLLCLMYTYVSIHIEIGGCNRTKICPLISMQGKEPHICWFAAGDLFWPLFDLFFHLRRDDEAMEGCRYVPTMCSHVLFLLFSETWLWTCPQWDPSTIWLW